MRATSNRKLAEALGVSETAVRKALAAGRISREADGSFDTAKAKRQWAGNTDAAQQRPTPKAGLRPVPAAALASLRETLKESGDPGGAEPIAAGGPSFLQARTANEVLKAQERKLRLSRLKGELIDRARATAQVFTLARQERDAWVQWPARVAADLAAVLGLETHTVQVELEAAVKAHLAELAELKPRLD
jgi:pyruvate/2-oxoglutarate dehydrogenase complex dihydrolipoamide acyltransferase (E2) component